MGALKNLWRWLNYRIDLLFQKPGSSVIFVVLFTTIFAVRAFWQCHFGHEVTSAACVPVRR